MFQDHQQREGPTAPVRILHLDDNPQDAQLIALVLEVEHAAFPTRLTTVQSKDAYLRALRQGDFDIILSDYRMPGFDGDEALQAAQAQCPDTPFIMVTGELGEERVIETLQRGATDYVLKDRIFRLVPAIRRALSEAENQRKRREAEEALRRSEERYRRVVDHIYDALLVDDVEGRVVYANDRFLALFGITREDLETMTLEDYVAPDYREILRDRHNRRIRGEQVPAHYEYQGVRKEGTRLWIEVSVVPLREQGRIIGTESVIRDITDRKRSEHSLRESEAFAQKIVTSSLSGMYIYDLGEQALVFVNPQYSRLTGYTTGDLTGLSHERLLTLFHPDDRGRVMAHIEEITRASDNEVLDIEYRFQDAGGHWIWCHSRDIVFARNPDGTVRQYLGTFIDITGQKGAKEDIERLNQELENRVARRTRELERANRELEAFSYSVSHDLKAPLRVINGFARLLAEDREASLTPRQREYLQLIRESASQMGDLINALLTFSRIVREVPQRSLVDVRGMVQSVVDQQREAGVAPPHARVVIGELPQANADPVLLRQVFVNLLSNAFKFSRQHPEPVVEIGARKVEHELLYFVKDNGVGFPAAHAEKLFRIFQRLHAERDFEGTGIGLANVRKIVERHGGKVCAEGEVGKGAVFYFTLPAPEHDDY